MNDNSGKNKKSRLKELKEKLYSRKWKKQVRKRAEIKQNIFDIKKKWDTKDISEDRFEDKNLFRYEKKGPTIFSVIFVISIIFFVATASFSYFYLIFSEDKKVESYISVSVIGPNSIKSGDVLEYQVKMENLTDFNYEDIELVISYPESTLDTNKENFIENHDVEIKKDLLSGGFVSEKFRVILSGAVEEEKKIYIKAYYKAKGYSSVLSINKVYKILIEESPISVSMTGPEEVLSKKEFEFNVNVTSNSKSKLEDLVVIIRYPNSFKFIESVPESVFSDATHNVFKIENLKAGETEKINIKGYLVGQNQEKKYFTFEVGDSIPLKNEMRTLFAKLEKEILIKKPDINLEVTTKFDKDKDYLVVQPETEVLFNIEIFNNLPSIISDLKIEAFIEGDMFLDNKVKLQNGFFDSNTNKVTWDKNTDNRLQAIMGNNSVLQELVIPIVPFDQIAGYFKDPQIKLSFSVIGTNFDSEKSEGVVLDKVEKIIKIQTQVHMESDILYCDGPFQNIGNTQPKVGEETTYTAVWKIYNSNSDIENVKVKAKLPVYVKFLGEIYPESSYLTYDEESREVTWSFKKINAFIGHRTAPKTVYFKVGIIPSSVQIGSIPVLVSNKILTAKDTYIEDRNIEVNTNSDKGFLENDSCGRLGDGVVRE